MPRYQFSFSGLPKKIPYFTPPPKEKGNGAITNKLTGNTIKA
jgi:hypothetical protein